MKKLEIIVQYFAGCPHYAEMIGNVSKSITEFGDMIDYKEEIIDTPEKAMASHFRGSPTLLINGIDFENMSEPLNPSLSCRFYAAGIPSSDSISAYINELIKNQI